MASNFYSSTTNGQGRVTTASSGNKTSSVAKLPGTSTPAAPNLTRVNVYGIPGTFDGSSNDGITDSLITSTNEVGNSIGYALGSALGTTDTVRKNIEISVANNNSANSDPLHNKVYDREPSAYLASGYYHDIHGVVKASGTGIPVTLSSIATSTGYYGNDQGNKGIGQTQPYYFKLGLTDKEVNLTARTTI